MADIFLSYAREDANAASELARLFGQLGWSVFWDRRIPAGSFWDEVVEDELRASKCVVALWSATSVKSKWVKIEANFGLQRGTLVPVALDATESPLAFQLVEAAQLQHWNGDPTHTEFLVLADGIARRIAAAPPAVLTDGHYLTSRASLAAQALGGLPGVPNHTPPVHETTTIRGESTLSSGSSLAAREAPISSFQVRTPLIHRTVLLLPPLAWLLGHVGSLLLTTVTLSSPFVVIGTVGGLLSITIVTSLALWLVHPRRRIPSDTLTRVPVYFILAGLVPGFVGLTLWLLGCAAGADSYTFGWVGCQNPKHRGWLLIVSLSSLVALVGSCVALVIEFGRVRFNDAA